MKKRDLERHLQAHGCQLIREGANHEMWENPATSERSVVPRHREIKRRPRAGSADSSRFRLWPDANPQAHDRRRRAPVLCICGTLLDDLRAHGPLFAILVRHDHLASYATRSATPGDHVGFSRPTSPRQLRLTSAQSVAERDALVSEHHLDVSAELVHVGAQG